jgi:hypothetical protein
MEWQEAGKGYPSGTKIKVLRDDDGRRTVILLLPKGFIMESILTSTVSSILF